MWVLVLVTLLSFDKGVNTTVFPVAFTKQEDCHAAGRAWNKSDPDHLKYTCVPTGEGLRVFLFRKP